MARIILTIIYSVTSVMLLSNCGSGIGGDRDASISILPASKSFQVFADETKKLQIVIIADPTASMAESQTAINRYFPAFTQELLNTGFDFEIFCSNTSYTGTTFGEIVSVKSSEIKSVSELQGVLESCVNVDITQTDFGDERGLEAARQTWSKIIENNRLDPSAVKLTMVVSNEDDCSRDLGKYPSDDNVFNRCIDQNVSFSPVEQIKGMAFPITDNGYADLAGLFPDSIKELTKAPITLYPIQRYVDFFEKQLNYVATGRTDAVDELLVKRGHIFAPVILRPPADVGKDVAYQCTDAKTKRAKAVGVGKVMSFGMRYFQVAEATGNQAYSLCEELEKVFQDINVSVQKEVEMKQFFLARKPKNPQDLKIEILREISDVERATKITDRMQAENSRNDAEHQWTVVSERTKVVNNQKIKVQQWSRTMSLGKGFDYNPTTNEIVFNTSVYEPYNDKVKVLPYSPAGLDGNVDYENKTN